jgi:hypothetical protein
LAVFVSVVVTAADMIGEAPVEGTIRDQLQKIEGGIGHLV